MLEQFSLPKLLLRLDRLLLSKRNEWKNTVLVKRDSREMGRELGKC